MPPRAVPVTLTAGERKMLEKRARGAKTPHRDRVRAQIVLPAARGRASSRIAADLGISLDMVRKWRGRFAARGLDGLEDLPRTGRPRRISAADRTAVVALACQLPRVFIIVDNGSDHRGQAAIDRLRQAHPNAIMIHTPVHASWLNQVPVNRDLLLGHPEEGGLA